MNEHSLKSFRYIFGMNSVYLGNNYLWTSFESLFLPYVIELLVPSRLQTIYLGIIAFAGIIIGIAFNFLSGSFSDKFHSRYGRRRPMILIGSIIVIFSLLLFIIIKETIVTIFIIYILIEIGSNIAYGSYQPLIRDIIPESQRSTSSGVGGFFTLIGSAFGFGLSGVLIGTGRIELATVLILITIAAGSIITIFTIKREDYISSSEIIHRKLSGVIKNFKQSTKFKWMAIANFFITTGSSGLVFFEYYYFEYSLDLKDTAIYVAIAGVTILLISALSTVGIGILADKINKEIFLLIFPLISGFSILFISFIHAFYLFLVLGSLIGIAYGNYFTITNSYMSFIVPHGSAGKYLSIFLVSTEIGAAFSPLIYGLVLFLFRGMGSAEYSRLFELSSIFYFIGFALILLKVVNIQGTANGRA
ncbi:major facilitator superfamily permease [Ferroplasma acidiphilum]|uniref:Major facilitator superfamily permease n=2 Tax=Ferroplasma acidiphilum TaxID=74969 RepID=A0A1V0N455_9ARCH|nr:major facilitator superfamily permease [Ferroplasma acidiphilum]